MIVTGADPDSALAGPALIPCRDLFEVVTRGSGDGRAFRSGRAGAVFLVRPDGYLAARARPDKLQTVLGYLQELRPNPDQPARPPAASRQPDPAPATIEPAPKAVSTAPVPSPRRCPDDPGRR